MTWWNKLQAAEPKIVARVRAAVFVVAALSATQAHAVADALQYPALEAWILRAAAICGGIALLLRAGDKTPDNVVTQDLKTGELVASGPNRGVLTRTGMQVVLALGLTAAVGCAFIHKEFGSDVGTGLVDCAAAEVQPAKQAVLGDLTVLFATALTGDLPALLAQLEQDAVSQFGPMGLTALKCAAKTIASGYEAMHGADAGTSPQMRSLLLDAPTMAASPQQLVYLRAQDYAAKH